MTVTHHATVKRGGYGTYQCWTTAVTKYDDGKPVGTIAACFPTWGEAMEARARLHDEMGANRGPATPVGVSLRMVGEQAE